MSRKQYLNDVRDYMQKLAKEHRHYTRENLTTEEYTAIVEIREACNRIIELEIGGY